MSLLLVAALLSAADAPPEFDAWLDNDKSLELRAGRDAETLALLDRSLVTAIEPRRGVPTMLWAERFPGARSPKEQGLTPAEAARTHLLRFASLYRLDGATVARLTVSEVHDRGGAVIVGFARALDGVPALRDELDVVMTPRYELIALTGSLSTFTRPRADFRLDAATALATAARHLTGRWVDAAAFVTKETRAGGWSHHASAGGFESPPRARRVYFDDAEALWPAWHLELELGGSLHAAVISAADGRVLSLIELEARAAHTYRVWAHASAPIRPLDAPVGDVALPHPTGVPDGFTPAAIAPTLVTLDHGGISTSDSWLPAGANELAGNNVHAYADLAAPDGLDAGDALVPPSSPATFDYAYDLAQPANASPTQHAASATHAFFVTNWVHDALYDLGFDEQARNGQNDNYGRGGLGGDAMNVEVHDFDGRNNATMRTPADGAPGRLSLFLFDEGRPSTLTVTTAALPDGGTFLAAPPAVTLSRSWDVSGRMRLVQDSDGGFAGCEPWSMPAQYAGEVVLVDGTGCSVASRYAAAKDAGVAALVLNVDGCFALTEPDLVATCVEPDAGTQLRELLAGGATLDARLQRPAGARERDVALDTTVVVHEYGHFLTNRLIGDSEGLANSPARAMGEGWSDFLALWASLRDGEQSRAGNDQWQGVYAIGGWSRGGLDFDGSPLPAHYFGVRRYPYSTDRAKNPLTFKHVGANVPLPATAPRAFGGGANNAELHNAGEVWASMLWDAQVQLLRKPGVTVEQARTAMGRYLVASLVATPVLPTFLEARDALLAVVAAESPTQDFPLFVDAFAQRGLGVLAQSSDRRSTTNTPLAEDFTGAGGNYRLVSVSVDDTDDDCDADGQLDSRETGTLRVTLMNVGTVRMTQTTLTLASSLAAFQVTPAPLTVPPTEPFTTVTLTTPVTMGAVQGLTSTVLTMTLIDPRLPFLQNRLETTAALRLNADLVPSSTEDFESGATGWEFAGDGDFPWEDVWFVRTITPTSHGLFGPNPRGRGTTTATTPPLPVGAGPLRVVFAHQYGFENAMQFFDGGRLEVSTDGEHFTAVPPSALTPAYPGALLADTDNPLAGQAGFVGANMNRHDVTVDLGTQYANRTIWLRWIIGADQSGGASGWSVDDVRVTGLTQSPFTELVAHRNLCANHAPTLSGTSGLSAAERDFVTLVPGTAMDRDGDPLTFTWMQTSGPSVALDGNTFLAPDVPTDGAVLGFRVTVSDGRGGMASNDMTVTVRNVNRAPSIASTSGPQTVVAGERVSFTANGTDPDGDALAFAWTQEGEVTVTLEDALAATVTFVAPEVEIAEQLTFKVVALDGSTSSEPAFVALVVTPRQRTGCGCTSVEPFALLALGALLVRRRRVAPP
ncbi:MAG: M36 family metallopeptidase [Myxococcota bacterium]